MKTKNVVYVAIVGALYAVLTLGIAPLSYGPIQFRVSEFLKVFALFNPWTGVGIAIGDIFSAMASPYIGPWEMVFMPITDAAGAVLAYWIYKMLAQRLPFVPMAVYALSTAAAVAFMLYVLGVDAFWFLFISIGISELIILLAGIPIAFRIKRAMDSRFSRFLDGE